MQKQHRGASTTIDVCNPSERGWREPPFLVVPLRRIRVSVRRMRITRQPLATSNARYQRARNEPTRRPRQKSSTVHVHPSDCDLALTYRAQEFHGRTSVRTSERSCEM